MMSQKDEDSPQSCEVPQEEPGAIVNVHPVLQCPVVDTQEEASPCALISTTEESLGQTEELKALEEVQVVEDELIETKQKTQENVEEEKWVEEVVNVKSKSAVSQAQFEVCSALEPTAGCTAEDPCREVSASTVEQDSDPTELLETQPEKQQEHPQDGAEEPNEVPAEASVTDNQRATEQHNQEDHPEIQEKIQMEDSVRGEEHGTDEQSSVSEINDQPNRHLEDTGEEPSILNQVTEESKEEESKDGGVAKVSVEGAGESPVECSYEEEKPADTEAQPEVSSVSVRNEDNLNQCSDRAGDGPQQEVVEADVAGEAMHKETVTEDPSQDPSVDTGEQQIGSDSSGDATELETLSCVPSEEIGVQESHKEEPILEEPVKGAEKDICPVEQSSSKEEVSPEGTPKQETVGETMAPGAVGLEEMDQVEKGDKALAQPLKEAQSRESEEHVGASTTAEEDLVVPPTEEQKQVREEQEVIQEDIQEVNEDKQEVKPHSEVTQL